MESGPRGLTYLMKEEAGRLGVGVIGVLVIIYYHIDPDNLSRFVKESRIIKSTD
jgi:hypothetical protein